MGTSLFGELKNIDWGMSYPKNYTQKTNEAECTEVYTIDAPGVSGDKVSVAKRWDNRYKDLSLDIVIDEGNNECRKIVIPVAYKIFDKYSYVVENGRITITLYEIINEEPKFDLV